MKGIIGLFAIFAVAGLPFFSAFCQANDGAFPWVAETGLRSIEDPNVDMALRVELIRRARKSIRIATYQQMSDPQVGLPLLHALREAAARGVRIQFISARLTAAIYDLSNVIPRMLADSRLSRPAEVIFLDNVKNKRRGWNLSDNMHEKIFIVDDSVAIVGGRNQGGSYLNWLDYDALIVGRALLSQIGQAFEDLWVDALTIASPITPKSRLNRMLPSPWKNHSIKLNESQQIQLTHSLLWLANPGETPAGDSAVFHPARARVLAHRFFNLLLDGLYADQERLGIPDPVVDELERLIATAHEVRISTLFTLFHPRVKKALAAALVRGAKVYVHFNGKASTHELLHVPIPLPYVDSLSDLIDLMNLKQADGSPVQLHVAIFQVDRFKYLHRKLFIIDDQVFFGSHNFNLPSTISNSEIAIQVSDQEYAQHMSLIYDRDFTFSGRPLSREQALLDYETSGIPRYLAKFLHNFF